jgi:hypothetical protein
MNETVYANYAVDKVDMLLSLSVFFHDKVNDVQPTLQGVTHYFHHPYDR